MDQEVKEIKRLLHLEGFALTQCGRLPQTKVTKTYHISPSQFKSYFGTPVKRWGKFSYIFKCRKKVSHLLIQPESGFNSDAFWDQDSETAVKIVTSSYKIISEFVEYLKSINISVN